MDQVQPGVVEALACGFSGPGPLASQGLWGHLLGPSLCRAGWPGRGFICIPSSGRDSWPPLCSRRSPLHLPFCCRGHSLQKLGLSSILEPTMKSRTCQSPQTPCTDLKDSAPHTASHGPSPQPLGLHRACCSEAHAGQFRVTMGPFRGQSASGPAECPCTHGHLPRAFKITQFEKNRFAGFPSLSAWVKGLCCVSIAPSCGCLSRLGCWRQILGLLLWPLSSLLT